MEFNTINPGECAYLVLENDVSTGTWVAIANDFTNPESSFIFEGNESTNMNGPWSPIITIHEEFGETIHNLPQSIQNALQNNMGAGQFFAIPNLPNRIFRSVKGNWNMIRVRCISGSVLIGLEQVLAVQPLQPVSAQVEYMPEFEPQSWEERITQPVFYSERTPHRPQHADERDSMLGVAIDIPPISVGRRRSSRSNAELSYSQDYSEETYGGVRSGVETQLTSKLPGVMEYYDKLNKPEKTVDKMAAAIKRKYQKR